MLSNIFLLQVSLVYDLRRTNIKSVEAATLVNEPGDSSVSNSLTGAYSVFPYCCDAPANAQPRGELTLNDLHL